MGSSTSSYARVWNGRLDDLADAPSELLYARGEQVAETLAAPTVGVVGARACSTYGAQVARMLGRELRMVAVERLPQRRALASRLDRGRRGVLVGRIDAVEIAVGPQHRHQLAQIGRADRIDAQHRVFGGGTVTSTR